MTVGAVLGAQCYKLCHKSCFNGYEAGNGKGIQVHEVELM